MNRKILYLVRLLLLSIPVCLVISCSTEENYNINFLLPEDKVISNSIDGIEYTSGNWQEITYQNAEISLGNHRAVINVPLANEAVRVHLPWRRRDINLRKNRIIIINSSSRDTVENMIIREYNDEYSEILFQPEPTTKLYHIYYYPFETTGSYYPIVNYLEPTESKVSPWTAKYLDLGKQAYEELPAAEVVSIESINDFNSFFPMEIASTNKELESFLTLYDNEYYVFPEFRTNPIRMTKKLPHHWLNRGLKNGLKDEVLLGEYYTFQLGAYAAKSTLNNIEITYTNLKSGGNIISSERFGSINIDGVDLSGKSFTKVVNVEQGSIQPLWIGLQVPEDTKPGEYSGMIIIRPKSLDADTTHLSFTVRDEIIKDYGDDEPANMSRLRWFNSRVGADDDFIIAPFTPVVQEDMTLKILGREIDLSNNGLPVQIRSFFTEGNTSLKDSPENILSEPINFKIVRNGSEEEWSSSPFDIEKSSKGRANWTVNSTSSNFNMRISGTLEYDGMLNYQIEVIAEKDVKVDDIKLTIPYKKDAAKYILGLGNKGSARPKNINWKWDVTKHHEGVWLGGVNKGLQYVLRDKNYQRPLNTNFYQSQPLNLPPSWYNDGKGGISIRAQDEKVISENFSGSRNIAKGDTLNFHIRFLITPFKTIDTESHFNTRFVHKYIPVDSVKGYGGTVVNVHHANEINPYINYPFFNLDLQKKYIDEAHSKGIKVKLYNTIRELSYKSHEMFPMRSLGFEILNDGEGGGHPWLQEHLEDDYHKAWHAWRVNDAAILNKGTSRWTNYYIEGLSWLAKNQEIDGLYLDDIAFSRETVKRIVSVLNQHRSEVVIDLHSANQYNDRDGFINSAFLYMEHFPYISRLWFGEYFEYDLDPDYWLTEVSGIPFGLTGEMLQDGGHPYRGMVYGMTTRVYGKYNPQPIWKLFDDFNIAESEMIGYWVKDVPVNTNNPKVPVTVYKRDKEILLAFGSWSERDELITLTVDWDELGFANPESLSWQIPEVKGLQSGKILTTGSSFKVEKGQGLFLIIKED